MSATTTTEQEMVDALATFPNLRLEKCTPQAGGAYVLVAHTNGARWLVAVKRTTFEAGGAEVVRDIAARVAQCMIDDAMALIRPATSVIARGREA